MSNHSIIVVKILLLFRMFLVDLVCSLMGPKANRNMKANKFRVSIDNNNTNNPVILIRFFSWSSWLVCCDSLINLNLARLNRSYHARESRYVFLCGKYIYIYVMYVCVCVMFAFSLCNSTGVTIFCALVSWEWDYSSPSGPGFRSSPTNWAGGSLTWLPRAGPE